MNSRITRLKIEGFKSIRTWENFVPGSVNVLIGANGAGKSNLIAFFRMIDWMMQGKLQLYVGIKGASKLLFDGPGKTREIKGEVEIRTESELYEYAFSLHYAPGRDSLVFSEERFRYTPDKQSQPKEWNDLGSGHKESGFFERLASIVEEENLKATALAFLTVLKGIGIYQFQNTSDTARFKEKWAIDDGLRLKEDGGNLAPFLLRLREQFPDVYNQIVRYCRQILPYFDDFVLVPEHGRVLLQWKEVNSDLLFDSSMASDGMLRVFALLALLCHSPHTGMLLFDDPELGLHPSAIELIAGLIKSASKHTQIIAATQSSSLLNEFDPQDVTIIERDGRESTFKRLDPVALSEWLDEYSLADLWWKNVLGGKP